MTTSDTKNDLLAAHLHKLERTYRIWIYTLIARHLGGITNEERNRLVRIGKYLEHRMKRGLS